jgi:hypothetical protein
VRRFFEVQYLFLCPSCDELFIGVAQSGIRLRETGPKNPTSRTFDAPIQKVSPTFCEIYDEASAAESESLTQICGVGYRKALEYLIKD